MELDKLGIKYKEVGATGIVATIEGKNQNKKIALRADMDFIISQCSKNARLTTKTG